MIRNVGRQDAIDGIRVRAPALCSSDCLNCSPSPFCTCPRTHHLQRERIKRIPSKSTVLVRLSEQRYKRARLTEPPLYLQQSALSTSVVANFDRANFNKANFEKHQDTRPRSARCRCLAHTPLENQPPARSRVPPVTHSGVLPLRQPPRCRRWPRPPRGATTGATQAAGPVRPVLRPIAPPALRTRKHTHRHTYSRARSLGRMHVCAHKYTHSYVHAHKYTHSYVHAHKYTHTYVHTRARARTYACWQEDKHSGARHTRRG